MTSLSSLARNMTMLSISFVWSPVLAGSMTISLSMQTSISSHFLVYLSMALCSLVTNAGVRNVLTSCMRDCTALSAFPLHPLCEE